MAIGFVLGGLAGFGLSLANDLCRLRRRQSAAKKQRVRQPSLTFSVRLACVRVAFLEKSNLAFQSKPFLYRCCELR